MDALSGSFQPLPPLNLSTERAASVEDVSTFIKIKTDSEILISIIQAASGVSFSQLKLKEWLEERKLNSHYMGTAQKAKQIIDDEKVRANEELLDAIRTHKSLQELVMTLKEDQFGNKEVIMQRIKETSFEADHYLTRIKELENKKEVLDQLKAVATDRPDTFFIEGPLHWQNFI